jgi:DNA repair exonuclease SbcCD nuclease subunit
MPKIDESSIIYPGSIASIGFDEPGEHGMVVGNIYKDEIGKYCIDYKFVKIDVPQFVTEEINITDCHTISDVEEKLNIGSDYYKIVLNGDFHVDIEHLTAYFLEKYDRICRIEDNTTPEIDLEELSKEDTIRGTFAKLMKQELDEDDSNKNIIYGAIEYVLKG